MHELSPFDIPLATAELIEAEQQLERSHRLLKTAKTPFGRLVHGIGMWAHTGAAREAADQLEGIQLVESMQRPAEPPRVPRVILDVPGL